MSRSVKFCPVRHVAVLRELAQPFVLPSVQPPNRNVKLSMSTSNRGGFHHEKIQCSADTAQERATGKTMGRSFTEGTGPRRHDFCFNVK